MLVITPKDFVISRFWPIHFTVTLAGLKNIVRYFEVRFIHFTTVISNIVGYAENLVIQRFVKSRLHCTMARQ